MKHSRVAICIVASAAITISVHATPRARALFQKIQATGKIKGLVLDPNEARIPGCAILILGEHVTRRLSSNEFGEYESEVPAGTYRITADLPNYFPFRRAPVRVHPGTVVTINITPAQRILSVGLEVTERGVQEPVTMAPPPQYELFSLASTTRDGLEVLVQYQRKSQRVDAIEYTKALISFDSITIYAEIVHLDKNISRISASGRVIVDNGHQRVRANRAEVDLRTRSATINLRF